MFGMPWWYCRAGDRQLPKTNHRIRGHQRDSRGLTFPRHHPCHLPTNMRRLSSPFPLRQPQCLSMETCSSLLVPRLIKSSRVTHLAAAGARELKTAMTRELAQWEIYGIESTGAR